MSNKLILAVLQEDDYDAVVTALNQEHFFVTRLSSSGGFLRRKNITIMIGVQDEEQEKVVSILKANASKRKQTIRKMPITLAGAHGLEAGAAVPVEIDVGGVTVFTIPLDGIQKF
ncbi:MAG: cyclic-di-AMP receptor [Candidatus Heteroscillospira sp.]